MVSNKNNDEREVGEMPGKTIASHPSIWGVSGQMQVEKWGSRAISS